MKRAKEIGPFAPISLRIISTRSEFATGLWCLDFRENCALVFPPSLILFSTCPHACFVFDANPSAPPPATVVRAAAILPAHVDCAARNNFRRDLFRNRLVAIEGGSRDLRSEQARTDGIGQRDSGPERKNFRPDLRREPRDHSLRSIAARSGERCCRDGRQQILPTQRLRSLWHCARSPGQLRLRPRPAGRQHDYSTTRPQQFCPEGKDLSPKTSRNLCLRKDRTTFREAKNYGAVFEPNLFRRRPVWRRSGRARLFR